MNQRLSKVLAAAGVASRRACEELIFKGHVRVNGECVQVPQTFVDTDTDTITVKGKQISLEKKIYLIFNKPAGYLCSRSDTGKTIYSLFEGVDERLFSVGRLDKDTEGLLIMTNDGAYAQKVIHPSANIQKEYIAKTAQEISADHLKHLSRGVKVEGTHIRPLRIEKVRRGTIKVVIMEGKKREVRELLKAGGLTVLSLQRVRIGNLRLNRLETGKYRAMTEREKLLPFE